MIDTCKTPPVLLNLRRMANRLGVTIAWLKSEADAGMVPCLRAGRQYLFHPETVESALAVRAQGMEAAR